MVEVWIPVVTTVLGALTTLLTIWYRNRLEKEKRDKECFLSGVIENESELLEKLGEAKVLGKHNLATYIFNHLGLAVDPSSMFDVQVKRIHEYKRQHLLALWVLVAH